MTEIVLASGNRGKLAEFDAMFSGAGIRIRAQADFGVPEAVEDGLSFVENAIIKARNAAACAGRPAFADDSGLVVDALGGAPGIYSARYAGPEATDEENLNKLLTDAADLEDSKRSCRFICVIAYLRHRADPVPIICEGVWSGLLLRAPRGIRGFGYDPIFWDIDRACSSAELDLDTKNRISHRGQAMRKLVEAMHREAQSSNASRQ